MTGIWKLEHYFRQNCPDLTDKDWWLFPVFTSVMVGQIPAQKVKGYQNNALVALLDIMHAKCSMNYEAYYDKRLCHDLYHSEIRINVL